MARLPDPTLNPSPRVKELFDKLAAKRGRIDGMYRGLLNHPDLLEHISSLGTFFRFGPSRLPEDLRELAVLRTAAKLRAGYEWIKHQAPARAAGLGEDSIEDIKNMTAPNGLTPEQGLALEAVDCVLEHAAIPPRIQDELEALIGLEAVIELVVLCGFYEMIAGVISAFEVPLPEGSQPPFTPDLPG